MTLQKCDRGETGPESANLPPDARIQAHKQWEAQCQRFNAARPSRIEELEAAITRVVTQRGDDLCWRDIYTELARLVGIEFCPQLMADPEQFAANCKRFDASLRDGKYTPVYCEKSHRLEELEALLAKLTAENEELRRRIYRRGNREID